MSTEVADGGVEGVVSRVEFFARLLRKISGVLMNVVQIQARREERLQRGVAECVAVAEMLLRTRQQPRLKR